MPKSFSPATLRKFEDASASIPLRPLVRAFEGAAIRMGADPADGEGGARRTQFRRYVAGVDQRDPRRLDQLCQALSALIAEVAYSKQEFLVKAAESDGFAFEDGAFRQAKSSPRSFAVTGEEDLASIQERARRLYVLADDTPKKAIDGARELLESVCLTVLTSTGARPAKKKSSGLTEVATSALHAIEATPADLEQLAAVVERIAKLRNASPRHARLAVGAAVTFSEFVAETCRQA